MQSGACRQLLYLVSHPLAAAYGQASQAQPRLVDESCAVPDTLYIVQLQGAHVRPLPEPLAVKLQRADPAQIEVSQVAQVCQIPHTAAASSMLSDKQSSSLRGLALSVILGTCSLDFPWRTCMMMQSDEN